MTEAASHPAIDFAAAEIRRYLLGAGLSEKDLPGIHLKCRGDDAEDAYVIEATPECIAVTGSNPRSVLIGAYALLKELGFRFFAPGKDFTVIPRLSDPEQLRVSRKESRAVNAIRGVCIEGADSLDQALTYIDWLPKAGMNTFFLQFFRPDVFLERWASHQNNPTIAPEPLTEEDKDAYDRTIAGEITRRGLLLHRAGHGWTAQALGFAGNGWQKEQEPEDERLRSRIALLNGERRLFGGVPANTNLCYSREDVQQALADEVIGYVHSHPEASVLHFWLADTYNNLCECENCRKTTLSDQYVRILNRIDDALTKDGSFVRIVFLLYQELLYPPRTERIRHPERFILMFAPISRTFETSYPPAAEAGTLPPFHRNAMRLPLDLKENLRYYAAWRQIFPGDAFIYDYHLGRVHYGDPGYMKIAGTLYRDLERIRSLGFQGMVACQELRVMMPNALPIYLMARMLWGDTADFDGIADDYFTGLYGEYAARARQYFETVSALCDTDYANANGPRLRKDLTERYLRIGDLSRSEEAALPETGSPIICRYRSTLRQNAAYADAVAALTQSDDEGMKKAFDRFCSIIREREKQYPMDYDVYRAIEVMTKYTGLKESVPAEK